VKISATIILFLMLLQVACGGSEPFAPQTVESSDSTDTSSKPTTMQARPISDIAHGEARYFTPPATGITACVDCHGENPISKNFGNIWSGKNAPELIQRAISLNTGGMGYFRDILTQRDIELIASFLGIYPREFIFSNNEFSRKDLELNITASPKKKIINLTWETTPGIEIIKTDCLKSLEQGASCSLTINVTTSSENDENLALTIRHDALNNPIYIPIIYK
jgi:hypothetical protein